MKVFRKLQQSARIFRLQTISILLIILTILIFYRQDFSILANEAVQNEAMSHVILVPLLASFLLYRKKELVKASLAMESLRAKTKTVSLSEIVGIALCLSAFLLYWYGSYTFYPLEYHLASLIIFLMGITLILFNVKTLIVIIFPILFLLFLIPPPSSVTFSAGAALGNLNSQASYTLLKIVGLPVTLSLEYGPPTLVANSPSEGPLKLAIDLSCSGIYSLVAFAMFATFLVYIARGSITKKIALFPLGFIILMILNICRISLTVFTAYQFGEPIAMAMFHLLSGWLLVFFGIFLLLLVSERFLHLQIFVGKTRISSGSECDHMENNENLCLYCGRFGKNLQTRLPKRFWIKMAALLLCSYLVTLTVQAPVFAFAQRLTISTPDPRAVTEVFPQVAEYKPHFLCRYRDFEKVSGQDASLLYTYMSRNASDPTVYVLVGVSSSITNLHSWEACLVTLQISQGRPPLVNVLDSREVQIMQDPPITGQYIVFEHPSNYTQVTLYWYLRALFKTGLTIEPKYTRISLIVLTKNPDDYPELEQKLVSMGRYIAAYWEPIKGKSLVSIGIPTMQVLFGIAILSAIILQVTQYTNEWRKKTTNLKIFEALAPAKEKILYQTIKELNEKTKETTAKNIASALEEVAGKETKINELVDMLKNLEQHGIIRADIVNKQDDPRLVWKP